MRLRRRHFLGIALLLPPAAVLACSGDDDTAPASQADAAASPANPANPATASTATPTPATAQAQLAPTPACGDDDPTPAQTEGPYFTPNSPERASLLESGMPGTRLVVEGLVLSRSCQPLARALVDFWQCDSSGVYDNAGYRLRGHQFTDASGRYRLQTILPGIYPGRTRHIHVKVQAPNRPVLTTQLYFPDEPGNQRDGIYNRDLELADYQESAAGKSGRFDFVLNLA